MPLRLALRRRSRATTALALLVSVIGVAASACGADGATDPGPQTPALVVAEMVLVDGAGNMMYSHRDHWHGFPVVPVAGALPIEAHFVARSSGSDDHEPPPRNEWFTLAAHADADLRVVVTDTTVARWAGDKLRGALDGRRAGASVISFVVRRGATTLKEAPPLNFVVR